VLFNLQNENNRLILQVEQRKDQFVLLKESSYSKELQLKHMIKDLL